jgi:hypothetical protein
MMHPYFLPLLAATFQGICMLVLLAGYVFLSVVAWRFMKAHEMLVSTIKDASKDVSISLRPKE